MTLWVLYFVFYLQGLIFGQDYVMNKFVENLHHSTQVLSYGKATVMGNTVDAVLLRNLYGQELVWGYFNCDKGKFKGKRLTNSAATEGVNYVSGDGQHVVTWSPVYPEADTIPPMRWPSTDHLSEIVLGAIEAQMEQQYGKKK